MKRGLRQVHALVPGSDDHAALHRLRELRDDGKALTGAVAGKPRQLPLRNDIHAKTILRDVDGIVPRGARAHAHVRARAHTGRGVRAPPLPARANPPRLLRAWPSQMRP